MLHKTNNKMKKLFFYLPDAINWLKENTNFDVEPLIESLNKFDYVQTAAFGFLLSQIQCAQMINELVWYTQNDLNGFDVPNLYIINYRVLETASLVNIVSGNDTYVQYINCMNPVQLMQSTNRQFTLNSQPV